MFQIFGNVTNPIENQPELFEGGLIILFNNMLRLIMIAGGLYAFINIFIAGFKYMMAAGNAETISESWKKIWQSFAGLMIMVASFILAVIIGALFFNDPMAILNPKIPVAGP